MYRCVAVIPCYNHPKTIGRMVDDIEARGLSAIVVDDGSDETCAVVIDEILDSSNGEVTLVRLSSNQGKGGAMMAGLLQALEMGYTHALQIDADGQHDASDIPIFLNTSRSHPDAVICGEPIFDDSVPKGRLYGRYLSHVWLWINTLSHEIHDSMCGFRVYPLAPVVRIIERAKVGRRMDFDIEILVRLHWEGLRFINIPTHVRYPLDGISHFKSLHDNVLISFMHTRMAVGMLIRLPILIWRRVVRKLK